MMAFTMLGAFAMTKLPAGRSAVLSYTTLIWVAPISILIFGEVASWTRMAGLVFGIAGVGLLVNPFSVDWSNRTILNANLMLLGAAACWAICILHLRYYRSTSTAFDLAPWQMSLATLVLVATGRSIEGPFSGDFTPSFWAILLFVGPLATAFCFCAVNSASSRLAATTMSIAMLGVPVTGVAVSLLLLGEYPSPSLIFGTLTIAAGMIVTSLPIGTAKIR
jgi:drug/metabolite transporter (DMT)-like permease